MSEEKGDAGVDLHHAEQCSKVVCDASELERTIDWKQGLAIALGVPLLILPSLGYFPLWVSSAAIIVWGLSVFQGFMQNLAYGELATAFPHASGLPGFAQNVFKTKDYTGKFDKSKLIGGFSAWSYWFAWNPVLAIYAILVGSYTYNLFPILAETFSEYQLSLVAGIVIFGGLILVNYRGLEGGALAGYILAALSLLPLIVITLAPFATGDVVMSNITSQWLPADWAWDAHHILILLGLFAMAQWSACAWETAAVYGPEYKNPGSDIPKALFVCGVVCFFSFVLVQAAVIGVLGVEGTIAEPISPMIPVAQAAFGSAGAIVAIVMLIAAMVLMLFGQSTVLVLIMVAIIGFAIANIFSIIFSMALQKRPERGNEISGLMIMGVSGGAVLPPLMGLASDAIGQTGGMLVILAGMLYLLLAAYVVKSEKK